MSKATRIHLQWGRNLFVAESTGTMDRIAQAFLPFNGAATCSLRKVCVQVAFSDGRSTFNGAATCSLRKVRIRILPVPEAAVPSMGPQLVRCGKPKDY